MKHQKTYACVVAIVLLGLGLIFQQVTQPIMAHGSFKWHSRRVSAAVAIPAPSPAGRPAVGYVSGTMFIKNFKSDIYLDCKNFEIEARRVGGSQEVLGKATAYGNLSKKSCRYSIGAIPAATSFELMVLKPAALEGRCTQEKFVADGTLPIKVKSQEKLFRNLIIRDISCIVVK